MSTFIFRWAAVSTEATQTLVFIFLPLFQAIDLSFNRENGLMAFLKLPLPMLALMQVFKLNPHTLIRPRTSV